jgi:hypothetical protein
MKLKNAQQGHAHLMLFVAVGFALIGFVGFNVYNQNNAATLANSTAAVETSFKKKPAKGTTAKQAPTMRIIGRSDSDNKNVIGYVELSVPGKSLERKECSGSESLNYDVNRSGVNYKKTVSMNYVKQKELANGNGYCVVRIMTDGKVTGTGSWGVNATFKGNKYLNALPQQAALIDNLKKDVVVRIVGRSSTDAKTTLGYVEVKVSGMNLHKSRCSGKVHVAVAEAKTGKKLYEKDMPVRYVKQQQLNNNQGYCVVRLPKGSTKTTSGAWNVVASFKGNDFLNYSPSVTTTFTN